MPEKSKLSRAFHVSGMPQTDINSGMGMVVNAVPEANLWQRSSESQREGETACPSMNINATIAVMNLKNWFASLKPNKTQPAPPVKARIPKRESRFLPPW
jgi:hypothetical protein